MVNQATTPEGARPVLQQWLEAFDEAQTGRFEDLEANLGTLSEERWNAMVETAEDAWEKVQVRRSAVTAWLHEQADERRKGRTHDVARGILVQSDVPAPEAPAINPGCMGRPMKLSEIDTSNREAKFLARNPIVFAVLHQHDSNLERRRAAREIIYRHFHAIVMISNG